MAFENIKKWYANTFPIRVYTTKTLSIHEQHRINEALLEHKQWGVTAEGDEYFKPNDTKDGSAYGETSIFEEMSHGITSTIKKADGTTELSESDFLGAGLNVGQMPESTLSLGQLRLQQAASINQWATMPVARSVIENYKRYVIGRGIAFDCPVSEVGSYLSRFWKQNNLEETLKNDFRDFLLEGELFYMLFDQDVKDKDFQNGYDTPVIVRRAPSHQIDALEIDPKDYRTRLAYKRSMPLKTGNKTLTYLDVSHPKGDETKLGLPTTLNKSEATWSENVQDARMQMFKYGLTFDQRGRIFMETILRWNRIISDFAYDRGRINHLRTKVFLIETRTTKSGAGTSDSYERLPKGGIKLIETNNRTYKFVNPQTGAGDAMEDFKLLGYTIGAGVAMPIHILLQNAENNNYSSISEASNPYAQAVKDLQDEFGDNIKQMLKYVLAQGVRTGELPKEVEMTSFPDDMLGEAQALIQIRQGEGASMLKIIQEVKEILPENKKKKYKIKTIDVPVQLLFPELVHADPKVVAESIQIYRLAGIWSLKTCIIKSGQDPEVEMTRMAIEDDTNFNRAMDKVNRADDNGQEMRKDEPIKKPVVKPTIKEPVKK